jgi:CheY-like chemotaxis protein
MIKILVIDDDRMNCELIQSVFTRHGYQVLSPFLIFACLKWMD